MVDSFESEIVDDWETFEFKGAQLNRKQRRKFELMLRKFKKSFGLKLEETDFAVDTEHVINVKEGSTPVISRMPFYGPDKNKMVQELVRELLRRGMIERSNSEWRAPLLVVKKPSGEGWRVVSDFRGLNERTIPDSYPMPLIDEILAKLSRAKFFTKMDLTEGFWHILMSKASKKYTGFAVQGGSYVWKRMPMGLKNSPATFQRMMDEVFSEWSEFCQAYIDDLIVFSETFEEHVEHVRLVLTKLREKGLIVKLPKCEFCVSELDFLGHNVGVKGVRMQKRKVEAIKAMKPPRNETEMKRFLGMAGYYRRYIQNYARRTHRLGQIARGREKFSWTDAHQIEFDDIKKAMTEDPVMAYPDWDKQFILTTDASLSGLGAVLSQMYPDGERVVAYESRRLTPAEANYGITQLEALAVVWAVEKFRDPYLITRRFKLITDHSALKKLQTIASGSNRLLERWSLSLTDYDIEIVHRAGKLLVQADCLSRAAYAVDVQRDLLKDLVAEQKADPLWKEVYFRVILEGSESSEVEISENHLVEKSVVHELKTRDHGKNKVTYRISEDFVLRKFLSGMADEKSQICLPRSLVPNVLKAYHEEGHWGHKSTAEKVKADFVWYGMGRDIRGFCRSCHTCQCANKGKKNIGRMSFLKVWERNELIGIDTYSGLPGSRLNKNHDAVIVITDFLTRFTWVVPVRDTSSVSVARALLNTWLAVFGPPKKIISDRGRDNREFSNQICEELYKVCEIEKLSTVGYRPQAMGTVERFNRTMTAYFTKECFEQLTGKRKFLRSCGSTMVLGITLQDSRLRF